MCCQEKWAILLIVYWCGRHLSTFTFAGCAGKLSVSYFHKIFCGTSENAWRKSHLFSGNWSQRALERRLKCVTPSLASSRNFWRPCTTHYCYCQPCAQCRTVNCLLWHCWQYSHVAMRAAFCVVYTDWPGFELRAL